MGGQCDGGCAMRRHEAATTLLKRPGPEDEPPSPTQQKRQPAQYGQKSGAAFCFIIAAGTLLSFYLLVFPKLWTSVGDSYNRLGDRRSALQAYDRVLRVWPRLFNADDVLFSRGTLLMSRQEHWEARHVDAEADFRAVLASQPDNANAHSNLGLLLSEIDGEIDGGSRSRLVESASFLRKGLALAEAAGEPMEDLNHRRHTLGAVLLQLARAEDASALLLYPHLDALESRAVAAFANFASTAHSLLRTGERPTAENEFTSARMVHGVLSVADRDMLVSVAEAHAATHGGWTRGRHEAYPTTDLPLSALPRSSPAVAAATAALRHAVLPAMVRAFPSLAGLPIYVDDAFVAKYGEQGGAQRMLAFHSDGTPLSFICTLAEPSGGGGTVFRSLLPTAVAAGVKAGDSTSGLDYGPRNESVVVTKAGDCLIFAGGALLHGGAPVTAGVRHLLIGFVEVGRADGAEHEAEEGGAQRSGYAAYHERWIEAKRAGESRAHSEAGGKTHEVVR